MKLELGNGVDSITLFRAPDHDKLLVDHNVFHIGFALSANELKNQAGVGAPVADIATAQFIYVIGTSALFYDDDGTGAAAAPVQVATVNGVGVTGLALADFYVV